MDWEYLYRLRLMPKQVPDISVMPTNQYQTALVLGIVQNFSSKHWVVLIRNRRVNRHFHFF
jgi:hypothetical protein